jgi:predicted transcriptional regulator
LKFAHRLVYARRMDLAAPDATPIGVNCRFCERHACPQRAAPPLMRPLDIDQYTRSISPFTFKGP